MFVLQVFVWWLVLQVIGLLALPISYRMLRNLPNRGFGFARQVGLILSSYALWLLVTLGVLENTTANMVLVLVLMGIGSVLIWRRHGAQLRQDLARRKTMVLTTEIVFAIAMLAFAFFRAHNPEIAATEKPMEFGFVNAILRSRTFPPHDPWLSGYGISYYYLGYITSAMLTRLSGLPSDVTFNLTGTMLFALTVNGALSLGANLVEAAIAHRERISETLAPVVSRASLWTGGLAAVLVALMGNLEGIFEILRANGLLSESMVSWLDVKNLYVTGASGKWYPTDTWWWWRAARVIHDRDAMGRSMEVIDEFPFFSFLLGDNHPHVLALPFVLLALALALHVLLSPKVEKPTVEAGTDWLSRIAANALALWPGDWLDWLLWPLMLGALGFLNTWDLPTFLGILVLAYAIQRQRGRQVSLAWAGDVVWMGLLLAVIGVLLYLPFYLGFRSQAGGLGLVGEIKTQFQQYLLMLGVFVFGVASLLLGLLARYLDLPSTERRLPLLAQLAGGLVVLLLVFVLVQGWWTAAAAVALGGGALVLVIWGSRPTSEGDGSLRLSESTLFALLLAVAGLALTGAVEFIFLQDTFGNRMNTVFKFYYQAWVLLGVATAYGTYYLWDLLHRRGTGAKVALGLYLAIGGLLVAAGLSYTVAATVSKAGEFAGEPSLDGTSYVERYRPDDYAAVQWLREYAPEDAVMVEASGGSYSEYNWVSAHTGIPTVLGWGGHELQWRGNYDIAGAREPDIAAVYAAGNIPETQAILERYGIDYVYLGDLERQKYGASTQTAAKLDRMLTRVFQSGGVIVYGR